MLPLNLGVFEVKVGREARVQAKKCAWVGHFSAKQVLSDKLLGLRKHTLWVHLVPLLCH
jgi:hypothetical protein